MHFFFYSAALDHHVLSGYTINPESGVQVSLTYSSSVTPSVASITHAVTVGPKVSASIAMQTEIVRMVLPMIVLPWFQYELQLILHV